jgi:cysteine protease ATG4
MDNIDDERRAPFGIHSIARVGLSHKRKPGDWYGPQAISNVLHELNKFNKPFEDFKMVVCYDGNVFLDRIGKKISKGNSVFVIIPVRIGLDHIQPEYLECLKELFTFESSCGIAGGQDYGARYFMGLINPMAKDPKLLYLDPHYVQESIQSLRVQSWIDMLNTSDVALAD